MQKRTVRIMGMTLLLATPLAAAFFFWHIEQRSRQLAASHDTIEAHFDRMAAAMTGIGTAQQAYVAPGQLDEPWFEQVSELVQQLTDDLAAVGPLLRSADAAGGIQSLQESIGTLVAADGRMRQNLRIGQDLMAADVVFSDGQHILDAMVGRLHELQDADRASHRGELASLSRNRWIVLGVLLLGALALMWVGAGGFLLHVGRVQKDPAYTHKDQVEPPATTQPSIDLTAAAALCIELSRVTDTAALTQLLGCAASIIDAPGLILWMAAGEQLFAVLGHGYSPAQMARFGPITRAAENAAAAAWRTGRLTVAPGSESAPGGLVAPMHGPAGCIGVLALEVRQGREQDPAVQAVAVMIAAQLSTAVAAWPAVSLTESAKSRSA